MTRRSAPEGAPAVTTTATTHQRTAQVRPDRTLSAAARLLDEVRIARMLAGDHTTAARLGAIVEQLTIEAEVLEGIVLHRYMTPAQLPARHEPARALGWWLRHDPIVRKVRALRGLPVPALPERQAAA